MREDLVPLISFPANLARIIALEERAGIEKADLHIAAGGAADGSWLSRISMAIRGKFNSEVFDKACIESASWVASFERHSVDAVAKDLVGRYSVEEIIDAEVALNGTANIRRSPLKLACLVSNAPIRLSLYLMAIQRHYGTGGEPVDIASGLPPKPPAPGHWGGRTPGYEQPLPRELFDKNLEAGEPRL